MQKEFVAGELVKRSMLVGVMSHVLKKKKCKLKPPGSESCTVPNTLKQPQGITAEKTKLVLS